MRNTKGKKTDGRCCMQAAVCLISSPGRVRDAPRAVSPSTFTSTHTTRFLYVVAPRLGTQNPTAARAARNGWRGREGADAGRAGARAHRSSGARAARSPALHPVLLLPRKSLVGCYKGKRNIWTRSEDGSRFPFHPLRCRSRNMQSHQLHGSEPVGAAGRKKQKRSADPSGREEPDDGGDDEPPRRGRNTKAAQTTSTIRGLLRDFFEQQLRLDAQRQEMMERHAQERLFFEEQWRQSMRRMEQERLMLEQAWMEREEQRRMREEDRAQRRDALLTSLLTRLLQGDL